MPPSVRAMAISETSVIIDYFQQATPEHLEMLGVDPTRLPSRSAWYELFQRQLNVPISDRSFVAVIWLVNDQPIGFSTSDKIAFGEHAHMHLHIVTPADRHRGIGTECVRRSVELYFEMLQLKRLFCEPSAFNAAPNRTLQKAGFSYVKTHMTVPGPLNFHQAVTRWVIERRPPSP
jgi:RimJ/RimL family protein N-acetyltransferase